MTNVTTPPEVAILTPVDPKHYVSASTTEFLCEQAARGRKWYARIGYECAFSRNTLVDEILEKRADVTHVFLLDSDVAPPHDCIDRLLSHNTDIIEAAVPLNRYITTPGGPPAGDAMAVEWMAWRGGALIPFCELPTSVFHTDAVATAALLVKTDVFRRLAWPWFVTTYERGWRITTDDMFFSKLAVAAGFDLWCDGSVRCHHHRVEDLLLHARGLEAVHGEAKRVIGLLQQYPNRTAINKPRLRDK